MTVAAGLLAAGISGQAQAALVDVTSLPVASGPMDIVFAFVSAADTSNLSWSQGGPAALLITNNGPGANPIGFTVAGFGAAGPVSFILTDVTTSTTFTAGIADTGPGGDGLQHARTSANFSDFGVGALSGAAQSAITALGLPGIFIGFEDRRGGDYDYNDLIYFFTSVGTPGVPAPAALALFGMGLLGLGLARRRV